MAIDYDTAETLADRTGRAIEALDQPVIAAVPGFGPLLPELRDAAV